MSKRRKKIRIRIYKDVDCHLCGFPIPEDIIAQRHPLLGTVDHIVPVSKGGNLLFNNKKPAHRCCNGIRGNQDITDGVREKCVHAVLSAFHKYGIRQSKRFDNVRDHIQKMSITSYDTSNT